MFENNQFKFTQFTRSKEKKGNIYQIKNKKMPGFLPELATV